MLFSDFTHANISFKSDRALKRRIERVERFYRRTKAFNGCCMFADGDRCYEETVSAVVLLDIVSDLRARDVPGRGVRLPGDFFPSSAWELSKAAGGGVGDGFFPGSAWEFSGMAGEGVDGTRRGTDEFFRDSAWELFRLACFGYVGVRMV